MECRHIFPDGRRCRCSAVATHVFCRYHVPHPRPRTLRPRSLGLGSWRRVKIYLATLDRSEVPGAILTLLSALLVDGPRSPSDRTAGAILRALVRQHGSVPFTLPTDPEPEPDWAWDFSRSLDQLREVLEINQRIQRRPAPQPVPTPRAQSTPQPAPSPRAQPAPHPCDEMFSQTPYLNPFRTNYFPAFELESIRT